MDTLENIATESMRLRVLKEHELGVRLEESPDGEPYVPAGAKLVGSWAGAPRRIPRPFVIDRNICRFLWYGALGGRRFLGRLGWSPLPSSKGVCSILPIASHLRAGEDFRVLTPARTSLLKPAAGQ